MSFLNNLREKPNHVKGRYAFMGATMVTGLVGIFWLMALPARFDDGSGALSQNVDTVGEEEEANPFSDIFDSPSNQTGSAIDAIRDSNNLSDELIQQYEIAGRDAETVSSTTDMLATTTTPEQIEIVEEVPTTTPTTVTETPEVPVPKPQPRTVLIGTTTSKKSE